MVWISNTADSCNRKETGWVLLRPKATVTAETPERLSLPWYIVQGRLPHLMHNKVNERQELCANPLRARPFATALTPLDTLQAGLGIHRISLQAGPPKLPGAREAESR